MHIIITGPAAVPQVVYDASTPIQQFLHSFDTSSLDYSTNEKATIYAIQYSL